MKVYPELLTVSNALSVYVRCALQVTYKSVPSIFGSKHWPRNHWGQVTGVIGR